MTPPLKRKVVKKVLLIGLGLDFLPGKKSNNKSQGVHVFKPTLWRELYCRYGDTLSSSGLDVPLIVMLWDS